MTMLHQGEKFERTEKGAVLSLATSLVCGWNQPTYVIPSLDKETGS